MNQPDEQKQFKGTMVLDVVKAIRALHDLPWDQHLTPEAQALIQERIIPSAWYPYEPVLSCLTAVFRLAGKKDPNLARQWGRTNGKKVFEGVYKTLIVPGEPQTSLQKLGIIGSRALMKNFSSEDTIAGVNHTMTIFRDDDPRTEPIYYLIQGWVEILIELAGGKRPRVTIVRRHWEEDGPTVFDVQWE
jgi:hypothetical protein